MSLESATISRYISPSCASSCTPLSPQEHNVVLVQVARLQDVPGVKTCCIRGKYDLPHVIKKTR